MLLLQILFALLWYRKYLKNSVSLYLCRHISWCQY